MTRFWIYPLVSLMLLFALGCGDEGEVLTPTELESATSGTGTIQTVSANGAVTVVDGNGNLIKFTIPNSFPKVAPGDTVKISTGTILSVNADGTSTFKEDVTGRLFPFVFENGNSAAAVAPQPPAGPSGWHPHEVPPGLERGPHPVISHRIVFIRVDDECFWVHQILNGGVVIAESPPRLVTRKSPWWFLDCAELFR